jgi:biopolymer transport protein ExbD
MASFLGGNRGGRKKFADNLNLVPFIDLFSTMIIFLLITAVWDQLAAIQVNLGTSSGPSTIRVPEESVKKVEARVKMTVTNNFVELFDSGKRERLPIENNVFDLDRVTAFMIAAREKYPDRNDIVVEASDHAKYEHLISLMDQALAQDFSELVMTGIGASP